MTRAEKGNIFKWAGAVTILIAMVFHTLGWIPWNSFIQMLGGAFWIYAGHLTRDKAIMLNFGGQFLIIIPALVYLLY